MDTPGDLRFATSHEWVRVNDDGTLTIGISMHAQEQLGDLVFVEVPETDTTCDAEDAVAVVESVKAASDIYAPVTGTITAVNEALADSPELINSDPYGDGWLFSMEPEDRGAVDSLMDAAEYEEMIQSEE